MASEIKLGRSANFSKNPSVGRRFRPIYDWIDNGNYVKALHELDKLIRKLPDQRCCSKALKSFTLIKLSKTQEAETLLEEVRECKPSDYNTLIVLTACYKELRKPYMICKLYEDVLLQDPANEDLMSSLFMSYVTVCDYQKQQHTALALHKAKPNNPFYYFWAVMSTVMQAYESNNEVSKKISLPLAERMIQKYINEGKIDAEQEIQLYLMVLDMQKKYKESLDVLNGPLGDILNRTVGYTEKKIDIYFKLEMYAEANSYLKNLLLRDIDSWFYYTKYFDSLFKIIEAKDNYLNCNGNNIDSTLRFDSSIDEALIFLDELQNLNLENINPLRGVYLARLELYSRLKENANKYMGNPVTLLADYFVAFSQRPCCFYDLKPYMSLLNGELLEDFLKVMEEIVDLKKEEIPKTPCQLERYLSFIKLSRFLGVHDHMNTEQKIKLADHLLECYHRCEELNNKKRPSEVMPNDNFIIIIAHLMYDVWAESNKLIYIREAIVVLEFAFTLSPLNNHMKLLLLKFYHIFGTSFASDLDYISFGFNNTQLDSLGYLHSLQMSTVENTYKLCYAAIRFFSNSYQEIGDHLTTSYRYGSFIKIIEMLEFREKLKYSIHNSMYVVEYHYISLLGVDNMDECLKMALSMEVAPEIASKFHIEKMVNNRDYTVFVNYSPAIRCFTSEHSSQTFSYDLRLLEIRAAVLSCIYYSARLAKEYFVQDIKSIVSEFKSLNLNHKESVKSECLKKLDFYLRKLKYLYTQLINNPPVPIPRNVFGSFFRSKLFSLANSKIMLRVVINVIELVQTIFSSVNDSVCLNDEWLKNMKVNVTELSNGFEMATNYCECVISTTMIENDCGLRLEGRREVLEILTNLIDTINTSCVLVSIATHFVKSLQNQVISGTEKIKANRKNLSTHYPKVEHKIVSEIVRDIVKIIQTNTSQALDNVRTVDEAWTILGCGDSGGLVLKKGREYPVDDSDEVNQFEELGEKLADRWTIIVDTVDNHISDSYKGALNEMIITLIKKQTQINNLLEF